MNRRAFLTGLLATTAAIPIVRAAPLTLQGVPILFDEPDWRYIMRAANVECTMIYYSEEAPIRFTGFIPAWSSEK